LNRDWEDPEVGQAVRKLRWNDGQLTPYLRNWNNKNGLFCTPEYVMRPVGDKGVDAGLLKYVDIIIQNTVANLFKKIGRTDDLEGVLNGENVPLNNGKSAQFSDVELVGWESEDDSWQSRRVYKDMMSSKAFEAFEQKYDTDTLMNLAELTNDEERVINAIEIMEMTARQYSEASNLTIPKIHRLHTMAIRKLRKVVKEDTDFLEAH
jgi:DNA-directed RNA polymerase specialized sigma24 family protein